ASLVPLRFAGWIHGGLADCEQSRLGACVSQKLHLAPAWNPPRFYVYIRGRVRRRRALISQRYGFAENGVADQVTQGAANHHLYAASENLFQVSYEASWKPWCSFTGDVDQEINIAIRCVFATRHGTEELNVARTMP